MPLTSELPRPQEVMHNVITSRMILHLREHARQSMGFTTITSGPLDFDIFSTGLTVDVADIDTEATISKRVSRNVMHLV